MEIRNALKNNKVWFLVFLIILTIAVIVVAILDSRATPSPSLQQSSQFSVPPAVVNPSTSSAPAARGDGTYSQEIGTKLVESFPLLPFLPVQSPDFSIGYNAPLSLDITLKTSSPSAQQKALDWIRSKGIDPKTHKITYK